MRDLRVQIGRVLLAQGETAEALTHLQEAVRLDPANPRSLLGLAEALRAWQPDVLLDPIDLGESPTWEDFIFINLAPEPPETLREFLGD